MQILVYIAISKMISCGRTSPSFLSSMIQVPSPRAVGCARKRKTQRQHSFAATRLCILICRRHRAHRVGLLFSHLTVHHHVDPHRLSTGTVGPHREIAFLAVALFVQSEYLVFFVDLVDDLPPQVVRRGIKSTSHWTSSQGAMYVVTNSLWEERNGQISSLLPLISANQVPPNNLNRTYPVWCIEDGK